MPRLYGMFADLAGRPVLVVGGGVVAERKVAALLEAGAEVVVGAPHLTPRLAAWRQAGRVRHIEGGFAEHWLRDCWLVVAATGEPALNRRVAAAAGARRLFVNVVDDAALSSFHVPAIVDRGALQVAISSGGAAPALAAWLRGEIEAWLEPSIGPLVALVARWRARIRRALPQPGERRRFYTRLPGGPVAARLRAHDLAGAEAALQAALDAPAAPDAGRVVLVGAGPGDPGLLTLHGLRALQAADVIVHDRLASPEVLALARRDAERIDVGKAPGCHRLVQPGINDLLVRLAQAGRRVVRLKGGDPFIFGRGGEELEHLRAHGIACEVVPGITAAAGSAAYAGVPLTHRAHAQSVRFVTAHGQQALDESEWAALARERQTLAVYMGASQLGLLRDRLLAHGRAPDTPFALVENATRPQQRVLAGALAQLPEFAAAHGVAAPALLIVGEVAALARQLGWYGKPVLAAPPLAPSGSSEPEIRRLALSAAR